MQISEQAKTPENLTNRQVAEILANHPEVWIGGIASDEQIQGDKQIFVEQHKSLAKFGKKAERL